MKKEGASGTHPPGWGGRQRLLSGRQAETVSYPQRRSCLTLIETNHVLFLITLETTPNWSPCR